MAWKHRCLSASRLLTLFCFVLILFQITRNQSITLGRLVLKREGFFLFSMLQATCRHSTFQTDIYIHLDYQSTHQIKWRWPMIPTHECHLCWSPVRDWAHISQAVLTGPLWDYFGSPSCSLPLYSMARCAYHHLSDNFVCLLVLYPNTCAS